MVPAMSPIRGRITGRFHGRIRAVAPIVYAVVACTAVTSCSGGGSSGSLPDAGKLLEESAATMKDVNSAGFSLTTEGQPPIVLKSGEVKLLKSGDAQGTLQVSQLGQNIEMNFVLLGDTVYYKGVTGGYQQLSRSMITAFYDPSALLDPNRGIAKMLAEVRDAKTEKQEKADGKDTYRIKGELPKGVASTLVPGVTEDLSGQIWISTTDKRPVKLRVEVPAAKGGAGAGGATGSGGSVSVSFSEFNAAYKITKPAS